MLLLTDIDNDDKRKGLMEVKVNIMQLSVALNQRMIPSYHLVHSRVRQEALLKKKMCVCVCLHVATGSVFEMRIRHLAQRVRRRMV